MSVLSAISRIFQFREYKLDTSSTSNTCNIITVCKYLLSTEPWAAAKKKLSVSVALPPVPVQVPSQRPLAPSVASVMSVANDKGDMKWSWGLCTDLAFALQPRKTGRSDAFEMHNWVLMYLCELRLLTYWYWPANSIRFLFRIAGSSVLFINSWMPLPSTFHQFKVPYQLVLPWINIC